MKCLGVLTVVVLLLSSLQDSEALSWHDIKPTGRMSCLVAATALTTYYLTSQYAPRSDTETVEEIVDLPDDEENAWPRQPTPLSDQSLVRISQLVGNMESYKDFNNTLDTICVVRQPGTEAHAKVRKFISSEMSSLGWSIDEQSFTASTPHGKKPFTNVIATLDPEACHRVVLACHYDSKVMKNFEAATDSAVPCSQMLHIVKVLDKELKEQKKKKTGLTLQLLFFDGEEAFDTWTTTDSLYGSRRLANTWQKARFTYSEPQRCSVENRRNLLTELDRIEVFILLDLLGAPNPSLHSFFADTKQLYDQMYNIERRLNELGEMEGRTRYFTGRGAFGGVEDDHIPFMRKDVPILHIIPQPFPKVWHETGDTKENLHTPTIHNLSKIFAAFIAWYMEL